MELVLSFFGLPRTFGQKAQSAFLGAYWHLRDHFVPHHRNNYHPHILSHRMLALLSVLLVSVKIFTIGVLSFGPLEEAFSSAINSQNIINLTNSSRQSFGLAELKNSSLLAAAAQNKANDMLAKGYFSHTTPDGKSPWDFISASGYNYLSAGENLAVNFSEAEDVENAWMNSPGHKANILNKNFQEIGIGISQGQYQGKNAIFVVQMFGLPAEQKVALDNKPTALTPPTEVLPAKIAEQPVSQESVKSILPVKTAQVKKPVIVMEKRTPDQVTAPKVAEEKVRLEISQSSVAQEGDSLKLTASILGEPVKVLAKFGKAAVMLLPKSDGSWFGEIRLSELTSQNAGLVLEAQDISGLKVNVPVGNFSGSTQENFNPLPQTQSAEAGFFGKVFHPKNFEQQFYLIFIAVLLSCLILAIGIKRHVQHLPLIANTSFVIILAVGLWMR